MLTNEMLMVIRSGKSKQSRKCLPLLNLSQMFALPLGVLTILSVALFHPIKASLLTLALITIYFKTKLYRLAKKLGVKIKTWQIFTAISASTVFVSLAIYPADAQTAPGGGGGLFNPLQQQTNNVLTAAGAGGVASSINGIFGLMNILVAVAGIGAVVYGGYQQTQGHTLRESFTPLAVLLMVYIGCSIVMKVFLGI